MAALGSCQLLHKALKGAAVKALQRQPVSRRRLVSTWICSALCLGQLLKEPCSYRRMAAKEKDVVLQTNITSQELWEEMLSLKGLIVVDVFQAWCGPCKPVVNLFKKIRNEVDSNLLHFAVAEVDSIDALEEYRGQCEPVFLFYTGGELVDVVRGANAPLLHKTILKYLVPEEDISRDEESTAPLQKEQQEGLTG